MPLPHSRESGLLTPEKTHSVGTDLCVQNEYVLTAGTGDSERVACSAHRSVPLPHSRESGLITPEKTHPVERICVFTSTF